MGSTPRNGDGRMRKLWERPLTQWVAKTLYYTAILIALLLLYGIYGHHHAAPFIYNEF
ncbi:teichoic acid D-Ala incorporation-associated protein DltX [Camelliibacillus cellulosilyticus]|uniref:Teichoic acid D-Ala incorporation-associated protein DltX n=1 Tax=Camelliibacillus cellulosilyticus TaxID=2174486 RepID=A0ABV9GR94_9BACL